MGSVLRLVSLAGLTTLGVLLLSGYSTEIVQAPAIVTTDTGAYCKQLIAQIDDLARANVAVPAGAAKLAEDGRQRCLAGQVRQGILHLRQAVLMMRPDLQKH